MVAVNGQKVFGGGRFYGIPNTATPTPVKALLVQNMSLDFKRDIKRLYGENQLPADVASGMLSVTGKAVHGTMSGELLGQLLLGVAPSTGSQTSWIDKESGISSTGGGGGAIVTVANSSLWSLDLGVIDTVTGIPMTRVASTAPSSGQYYVASGIYTLSSGTISGKFSYLYTPATGQQVTMSNAAMGKIGNFTAVMNLLWGTEKSTIELYNCMMSDLGYATVLDDYTKPAFGFEAATDATDTLGLFSFAEALS